MDLSLFFKKIIQDTFPNAKIVADTFHFVRLMHWALDNIVKMFKKGYLKIYAYTLNIVVLSYTKEFHLAFEVSKTLDLEY